MERQQGPRSRLARISWFAAGSVGLFVLFQLCLFVAMGNDWFDARFNTLNGFHELISQLMFSSRDAGVVVALYVVAQTWFTNRSLKTVSQRLRYVCVVIAVIAASVLATHTSNTQMRATQRESVQPESVVHS